MVKGDTVYFEENDEGDLVVSARDPTEREEKKIVTLNIDDLTTKEVELELVASYMKEFNKIIIKGNDIEKREHEVRDILKRLVAIEVIEQTDKKIVAKDFLNIKEISLEDLRKRLDIVIKSMLHDSKIGNGKERYGSVNTRDLDANRFAYLLFRVLRRCVEKPGIKKEVGLTSLGVVNEQTLVLTMERIADLAKRISREDYKSKLISSEINELNLVYEKVIENYNQAISAYQKKNYDLSRKVYSENKIIQKSCDKLKGKIKSANAFKILNLIREMSNNTSLIGEVGVMNSQSSLTNVSSEQKDL
ncbi:hypothetical protein HOF78_00825 [Candidatus Woesearchaeota archaeon]|nr:hypothetical protein [Candidatus Woesearchaeota archaeon]MBT6045071.1 hypothetical protein [Candidatus Woesearchaeota archaeon]